MAQGLNLPGTPTQQQMIPTEKSAQPKPTEQLHKPEEETGIKAKPKVAARGEIIFTSPGVIAFEGGQWVGTDNLLNVGDHIGIKIEILKPQGLVVPFLEETIKDAIAAIFTKNGISSHVEAFTNKPPLPVFHLLIMVNRIEKGFCIFCEGRLFEQVTLSRIYLPDNAFFQAITWEKQDLLVTSPEDALGQLNRSILDMLNNFIDRYNYYENLKNRMR